METDCASRVLSVIARELGVDESEVKPDTRLVSLVTDSLEMANLILELEDEFTLEISDEDAQKLLTVKGVVAYVDSRS